MPYIYFGFKPRNRGPTKLVVSTPRGDLEPTEPSKIKVYSKPCFSPVWSVLWSVLGLAVSILTYPKYAYIALAEDGLRPKAASTTLPFRRPGLAVPFRKGASVSETVTQSLENNGFQSMSYQGRLIWLKEEGTKDDYMTIAEMEKVESSAPVPARFMNPDSFQSYLTLMSITTQISKLFHLLARTSGPGNSIVSVRKASEMANGYMSTANLENSEDVPAVTDPAPKFTKVSNYVLTAGHEKTVASMLLLSGSDNGSSASNSGVLYNAQSSIPEGFVTSGSISSLTSNGVIMKFNQRLALPDPNIIGDILGRHFLLCLGDNTDDQFENLHFLKSGLSSLRLTKLGDELAHMFKCIEIAIESQSGCIPFFTGSTYEGCIVAGGPNAIISINGDSIPFLPLTQLKDEFLNVSDHSSALANISGSFSGRLQSSVRNATSMVELRDLCLTLEATQDIRDAIIRAAADLDFGEETWVVNPANLASAFSLMSNLSLLEKDKHPVGRMALFSKDPVLVALSCFGEKSCPTWDIPNGVKCSLAKSTPPAPPSAPKKGTQRGDISDAAWIMVVRYTDLFSAVDEFKKMASTLQYRSTASVVAKKVGHRVFSREKMGEFWKEMRGALRHVNPNAKFESDGDVVKRKREGDEGQGPVGSKAPKTRKLDF